MNIPRMSRVRQKIDGPTLDNIADALSSQLNQIRHELNISNGQSVAIACSSRGIANYSEIVASIVSNLKLLGLHPFIVPAIGSHGGATAEGQQQVLANLGITMERTGAPVRSSMEVVKIAETEDDIPVYIDKLAAGGDHIVLINRIKKHTEFEHEFESGLLKLMAIGLGKQKGAETLHHAMLRYGYPHVILTAARQVIRKANILLGVAVVENGLRQTAAIEVIKPAEIEKREKELFKKANELDVRLPFEAADILIIDEMGKEISGTGFDTKVVGRIGLPLFSKEPETPKIKRIIACDLTEESEGNAIGIGNADFVTRRLVDKIDLDALYTNGLTGATPEMVRIPMTLKNDKECLTAAIRSVGPIPADELKIIRIKNTRQLGELEVSEAYLTEISQRLDLVMVKERRPLVFDAQDNLLPFSKD
ncbi:MAG: DUF2088 domain-containing protein [Deltaproteobacteria bacterium]|nr:DUF2088 domain-containing protein [Deltaproteobacteria bacterium]